MITKRFVYCLPSTDAARSAVKKISGSKSGDIVFLTEDEFDVICKQITIELPPVVSLDAEDSALLRGDQHDPIYQLGK